MDMLYLHSTPSETYYYDNLGRIQGEYRNYSYVGGTLTAIYTFVDNVRHGPFTVFYDGKLPKITGSYKDGRYCGNIVYYYVDGSIQEEMMYEDSKAHGLRKKYYFNGMLQFQLNYSHDVLHKEAYFYDTDGVDLSTYFWNGTDLKIHPDRLTEKDKAYISLAGRLPPEKEKQGHDLTIIRRYGIMMS